MTRFVDSRAQVDLKSASKEYREQYFNIIDTKEVNQQLSLAMLDLDLEGWKPGTKIDCSNALRPNSRPHRGSTPRSPHPDDKGHGQVLSSSAA